MTTDRLSAMRTMAAKQPQNALVRFGLANELLKANLHEEAAAELQAYLAVYDDEGYGWLRYVDTLRTLGRDSEVREAIARGTDAATRYGHGAVVAEFEDRLDSL
ncbi:MAG: hypothetical protein C0516_03790 [Gemmatimonas sp.]|uniref:hypothetical protein n=1 Tax=Gemmatimonas sp. UBA7669 TaxID=1946568 RepID=UPI0025BF69D5|nr:hypothetical protein [Gemmatimonas sp. UBA7669]MBA3917693.1 hypothetical protein [Gemmatimonas sp.]